MEAVKKLELEKQGYRLVGNHSAVKVCLWTKKAICNKDYCYKQQFYNIQSHRCVQMTPALNSCSHRCVWCWRDIEHTQKEWSGVVDEPEIIINGCINEQKKYLQGFLGDSEVDKVKFHEAMMPKHFAISLSGEPTFYPKLPQLIEGLNARKITSFLVTNGTNPEMLKKLIKKPLTQLYITLPAPNKKIYEKVCNPLIGNGWERLMESLQLLQKFNCKKAIRLTLVKDYNMLNPEEYAKILKKVDADYFEFKAYMFVGYSRLRMSIKNMPLHSEIREFARKVAEKSGLKIRDEKENSRVVLAIHKP